MLKIKCFDSRLCFVSRTCVRLLGGHVFIFGGGGEGEISLTTKGISANPLQLKMMVKC